MERQQYYDVGVWLREYAGYLPVAEVTTRASLQMANLGFYLAEVFDVISNGEVIWADRDHAGCQFLVTGRNCDDEEFTIQGRFEAATQVVVIENVQHSG